MTPQQVQAIVRLVGAGWSCDARGWWSREGATRDERNPMTGALEPSTLFTLDTATAWERARHAAHKEDTQ